MQKNNNAFSFSEFENAVIKITLHHEKQTFSAEKREYENGNRK